MFTFLLPLFLVFLASVSTSAAFHVTVPSNLVAGGTGAVTWTRDLIIDPHKFTLSLRTINSDDDDDEEELPSVTVDSQGGKTGQETFTFPAAGSFKISAFPDIGLNLKVPFKSSDQFLVARAPPPQPPQSSPGQGPGDGDPDNGGPGRPPPPPPQTTFSQSSTSSSSTTSSTTQVTRSFTTQSTTLSLTTQESSSSLSTTATSTTLSAQTTVQATSSESPSVSGTETQTTIGQSTQPGYDSNGSVTDTNTSGNVNPTTPVATGAVDSSSNAGAIAGGIVGALMVMVVIVLLIYICRRRRKRKTTFFRDMMVRRRSEALVFSQVTIPSMWTYPSADVEKQSEDNHAASAHGQIPPGSFAPAQSTRTNTTSISMVDIAAAPSRSLDIQDAPWTERQIAVHDRIVDLQAKLIAKQSWSYNEEVDGYDIDDLKRTIERLERIMQSSWALGFTDQIPDGLE